MAKSVQYNSTYEWQQTLHKFITVIEPGDEGGPIRVAGMLKAFHALCEAGLQPRSTDPLIEKIVCEANSAYREKRPTYERELYTEETKQWVIQKTMIPVIEAIRSASAASASEPAAAPEPDASSSAASAAAHDSTPATPESDSGVKV